jgi:glycosyltransferase involved in cell wall biosynthesis
MVLEAFETQKKMQMVFVGNWGNSEYGEALKKKYSNHKNIMLLDAIYDMKELNMLRSNCTIYIHGHSAGGTNPSLVEAMYLGLPTICYSSVFNIFTTENKTLYFHNAYDLVQIIASVSTEKLNVIRNEMLEIAQRRYKWSIIAEKYSKLLRN